MLATQLKYDLLMFTRELFYLVFAVLVPPATYAFMGQLYGDQTYGSDLSYAQTYTPSFILIITFTVVFFSFGFDQVMQRTSGVEKRISLSPVSNNILLLSCILRSIIITSFGFVMISMIGWTMYGLQFQPLNLLVAYGFFVIINSALLVIASAIYSFFQNMNSALVFSIVMFQVVIFTGGMAMPIEILPRFVQVIAYFNPMYHMNNLFIDVWNGQLLSNKGVMLSVGYLVIIVGVSFLILRSQNKRKMQ